MSYHTPRALIGGQFIQTTPLPPLVVVNPCNEEVLGTAPACGPAHVAEALTYARAALPRWSGVHGWERAKILRGIARQMEARRDLLARTLSQEIGRPISQSAGEVGIAIEQFDWFAGEAERLFGETIASRQGGRLVAAPEPVGIVVAFTAWNFPINLMARKIAPALAAGCPVICRPSAQTPATSTLIVECCVAAGVPAGVVQLLLGRAGDLTPSLMAAEEVRKISLTGSTEVGRILLAEAAKTLKRCSMELGGHAPVVVCDDADIDLAATQCALFKYRNAGQVCISPNRFYVHEQVADAFAEKITAAAKSLKLGDSLDPNSSMGPLTLPQQREKIEVLVGNARATGATVLTGGTRPAHLNTGYFFEPTVLMDVPNHAAIMQEEPFGPVAAIARYADFGEAIVRANSTPYGLAAYAFTRSHARAEALSRGLKAGMVGINTFMIAHAEAPFGGIDHSGMGREGGRQAILDYTNVKLTHFMWGAGA